MEKWLRDVTAYLQPSLPAAFEPTPAPTADDADASLLSPKLSFWDRDQRQGGAWALLPDVEGPLSDLIPWGHQQMEPLVVQGGIDVLAWYRSYHTYGDRWGIYVRASGIAHLAYGILAAHAHSAFPRRFAVRAAMEALLRHEESHFEVEVYATGLELSYARPIYLPYSRHLSRTGHFRREESLANRRMVHHQWDRPPLGGGPTRMAIEALADAGPRDYSRWRDYRAAKYFDIAKNTLAAEIIEARYLGMATDPPGSVPTPSTGSLLPRYAFYPGRQLSTPTWDRCQIPVYLVGLTSDPLWGHIFRAGSDVMKAQARGASQS